MGVLLKPDKKAPEVFGRKTHHIRQFEKVYGMRTIITIVKADYCLMSQLLLNILSNVTLPPYSSFFVHFKPTFVTHPTKISRFSITVTPPPRDTACHSLQNSERALSLVNTPLVLLIRPLYKKGLGTINEETMQEIERFARIEIFVRQ